MGIKMKVIRRYAVDERALYKEIGRRMKAARNKAGLTGLEAALALGMSRTNLANIEGAYPTRVLLDHIYNAAVLYNCSVRSLLP